MGISILREMVVDPILMMMSRSSWERCVYAISAEYIAEALKAPSVTLAY